MIKTTRKKVKRGNGIKIGSASAVLSLLLQFSTNCTLICSTVYNNNIWFAMWWRNSNFTKSVTRNRSSCNITSGIEYGDTKRYYIQLSINHIGNHKKFQYLTCNITTYVWDKKLCGIKINSGQILVYAYSSPSANIRLLF